MQSVFAKRQLEKHGWTEGDGLGRKRDGMSAPIKVNIKMDKTGVGHDPGKEFTNHWWMKAFNDAAKKIKNTDEKPGTEEETEETKQKAEMSERKRSFYKGFVKGTTLTNGCETKDSDKSSSEDEDNDEDTNTSIPTLDDLHKFCGGATGHKAARFGIKMKGKLDRVANHDKQFEEMSKLEPGISYVKKKKVKSNEKMSAHQTATSEASDSEKKLQGTGKEEQNCIPPDPVVEETTERKKKKKQKKEKNVEVEEEKRNDEVEGDNLIAEYNLTESTKRKKKKKRKAIATHDTMGKDEVTLTLAEADISETNTKKKKKKRKVQDEDESVITNGNSDVEDEKRTKKRKRKHTGSSPNEISETNNAVDNDLVNDSRVCSTALVDDDGNLEMVQSRKKKKKSKHSEKESIPQVYDGSLNNSSLDSQNSKKQKLETDVPQDIISGVVMCERKKKKKKKNKDCK